MEYKLVMGSDTLVFRFKLQAMMIMLPRAGAGPDMGLAAAGYF